MPNYRRLYIPGGTFFFTLVTYHRQPHFSSSENVAKLRQAVAMVKKQMPFEILGAVILPDHIHFLWTLPEKDFNYSKRIGRIKVLFTHALRNQNNLPENISNSRKKHRESNVWQRRFWEHTLQQEEEIEIYLNYIHYNPVKHGLVSCPHLWPYSSFQTWVGKKAYSFDWACICHRQKVLIPNFDLIIDKVGE
ncbi:conserved hypothetical protein [Gloeothece citriformis PCC 7424]|uniref:Transposase IS200-like domain-containing protein n=1 Tax=Gloeothece citriformis (strain PCC 7424) TaxID=65393 RepID=B7KC06_GLOC7|nr:transposase [Gloeothece citriformis]ACK68829.1 conserved hypothetical protein [Gloeothece citriformis PCC 7424]